jgi:hypothetical protein
MPEDKIIKSGQITLPRVLFLVVAGAIIVFTVYQGGVFLSIGYWLLTLSICGLLFIVAIDYGVTIEKVDLQTQPATTLSSADSKATTEIAGPSPSPGEVKPRRRSGKPAKRRR